MILALKSILSLYASLSPFTLIGTKGSAYFQMNRLAWEHWICQTELESDLVYIPVCIFSIVARDFVEMDLKVESESISDMAI